MPPATVRVTSVVLLSLCAATTSSAQQIAASYTAIDLTPEAIVEATASGAANGQQVGSGFGGSTSGAEHAFLWFGSSASAVDLHPPGYHMSSALAAAGLTQVGWATHPEFGTAHAFLWRGSAVTGVDLNHAEASFSRALGVFNDVQVGSSGGSSTGFLPHAALWRGTAESMVDLNPDGYFSSEARAASAVQQVGVGNFTRALLWNGTANSAIDLTPFWCVDAEANGVAGDQQVGRCRAFVDFNNHAVLWNGSAQSAVDLHPPGYFFSEARAVANGLQVGFGAPQGSPARALVWAGTPESVVDLNQFLPEGYTEAIALGIDDLGNIVGWARQADGGQFLRAILWKPAPLETVITIDVKLGASATVNPRSGRVSVAILSTSEFDAFAMVDQASLTFGATGDEASWLSCLPTPIDVNRDGAGDLVCQFSTGRAALKAGSPAILRGRTIDGGAIVGSDTVRIVPPSRN